jgi:hypothetical protein
MYNEIKVICSEKHAQYTNTPCEQNFNRFPEAIHQPHRAMSFLTRQLQFRA